MIPLFTLWDGGTVVPGVLICETGVYNLNGQDATFGLTGNVTTDMEPGEYVLAGQTASSPLTLSVDTGALTLVGQTPTEFQTLAASTGM